MTFQKNAGVFFNSLIFSFDFWALSSKSAYSILENSSLRSSISAKKHPLAPKESLS